MSSILKVDQIQESTTGAGTNFSGTGSASAPTISIGNQTNKGFYHIGSDKIGVSVGGVKVGEIGNGYGGFTGNVIQVIQVSTGTGQVFNVGAQDQAVFYDITGLSLNITPRSSSNKILLLGSVSLGQTADAWNAYLRFLRDSTAVGSSDSVNSGRLAHAGMRSFSQYQYINVAMSWLDNPSTINSITYKIQICNSGGSVYPSYVNRPQTIITGWMFGVTSVFTAMEIAA